MLVPLGDTYEFLFTTRNFSTGAPYTLAGTPVLSVYEEANTTQITAGVSVSADYDAVTGLNQASIVATSGNGYEVGKYYSVVITTGTVNSVSVVGEVIGHFRIGPAENAAGYQPVDTGYVAGTAQTARDLGAYIDSSLSAMQTDIDTLLTQIANIAAVGTTANVTAESYTLTTGTETSGTYESTRLLDAVPHTHTDVGGVIDLYYQFDIGVQGIPSLVGVTAYSNGASDDDAIQAYNWLTSTWETVGTVFGKSGSTYDTGTYTLFTSHVGLGANIGKVRIRFYGTGLTSSTLRVDQIFVSYGTGQAFQYTAGVIQDAAATTSTFKTNLTQVDNFWNDGLLVFTSGALSGQFKPIQSYVQTNGVLTVDEPLTSAPADGDAFVIKAEHIHPVSQIVAGIWDAVLASYATAGSTGKALADVLVDTAEIGVAGAGLTNINLPNQTMDITGSLSGTVGGIAGTKNTLDDLNDIAAGDVWLVAIAEPTGTFSWAGNIQDIIEWLGVLSRNKVTQTSTTKTLRNDADAADISTSAVSDDGTTYTEGEWS